MERLKEKKKKRSLFCFVDLQYPVYKRARCHFLKFFKIFPCLYSLWFVFWFCCFLPPPRENASFVILASVCREVTILMFSEL